MICTVPILRPELEARTPVGTHRARGVAVLVALWLLVYAAALFSPPLLDDADATHAEAALAMAHSSDWVTLRVDGIRYLEKPPLPYWLTAVSIRAFGANVFAVHLPLALTVLALCFLAYRWGARAFDERTGVYAGAFTLTAAGTFLFTRIFIPDSLLALLLATALYATMCALEADAARSRRYAWTAAVALAAAVLTKGLIAPMFYAGTLLLFMARTRQWSALRKLHPLSSGMIFFALAVPWHIVAGLRNTGGAHGHGFFWFYFVNEHLLRFLGRRVPRDYNKLPAVLYWTLHAVWLFPWSFLLPTALVLAWRGRGRWRAAPPADTLAFRRNTVRLLLLFSAVVLVFFSLSTNQEYYTLPVYMPVLLLIAAALSRAEQQWQDSGLRRTLHVAHALWTVVGLAIAGVLSWGLWSSRHLPYIADIGTLLAHRGVGEYTLAMSHFFDLTAASFAALRFPALLAALAFAVGPVFAWRLRRQRRDGASSLVLICTAAVFLIAAHIALVRFAPMLSSERFAETIVAFERAHRGDRDEVLLFGDQAYGSSLAFYLHREVKLVDGRSTSMLFGSTFPDAPPIFVTPQELASGWGKGPRKLLFVPLEQRNRVDRLLGDRQILVMESSGKAMVTDRPL